MRTREPIQCMCDGCNRTATGHRITAVLLTERGPAQLAKIEPPFGWRIAIVRPELSLPNRMQVDAAMDAQTLARATGAVVEAALCERCQKHATFTPLQEPVIGDAGSGTGPVAMDEATASRDREREERERLAEEADRAAFEARRTSPERSA